MRLAAHLLAALAIMAIGLSSAAQGQVPRPAPTDFYPNDAQSIGDRLWVLEDSGVDSIPGWPQVQGRLEEIDLGAGSGRVLFERGVIGIAKAERRLYVLREDGAPGRYAVEVIDGQKRGLLPPLPLSDADPLIGVTASAGKVVVFSRRRTLVFQNGAWRSLDRKTSRSDQQWSDDHRISGWSMPADGSAYYVAYGDTSPFFYIGARGGGLERVDLKTGAVTQVRSFALTRCSSLISPGCDDVDALIPDPQRSGCVVAAVNSLDDRPSRIVRVCGRSISLVFERPCDGDCQSAGGSIKSVSDLAKGFALSLGQDVIYLPPKPGRPQTFRPQALRPIGGVMVDTSRPDIVVVTNPGYRPTSALLAVGRE